ncbi:hypothetical protein A2982_03100 [candidate division WWE3 bacterium RIFCSPLOWO2_01_FULL_39_13]|uniref:PIN domain-containing protein n=1 Tax=candidate division WWE3 bacterium RIFCSPLOWO2_01_FULL_39_13 TaxID=1802624 RepID=A0A1F4V1U4_UNCKA|nr:MAG: hypothetical protein A2982_03100 [candidate division WWE3 bacterium RIFCSPLOWO2_01_FULL_39_13]
MADNLLIDSSVIIDGLRKHKPAVDFIEAVQVINISIVTATELIHGCNNKADQLKIEKLLSEYIIFNISEEISEKAYELIVLCFLKNGMGLGDALIASTCILNNLTLVTKDKAHFQNIPSLKTLDAY